FFFSSRRRHTRFSRDWSSDVCSSDLGCAPRTAGRPGPPAGTGAQSTGRRPAWDCAVRSRGLPAGAPSVWRPPALPEPWSGRAAAARLSFGSSLHLDADTRVDQGVDDVDDEVSDQYADDDEQEGSLQQEEVLVLDRL